VGCLVLASCTVHGLIYEAVLVLEFSTFHLILTLRCNIALVCGLGSLADDCLFVESNLVFDFEIANFGNVM
jgi:hypothetical protein